MAGPCELVQPSSRVAQPACGRHPYPPAARLEVGIEGKAGVGGAGGQPVSTEAENYESSRNQERRPEEAGETQPGRWGWGRNVKIKPDRYSKEMKSKGGRNRKER